jgi:spore coat protein CotH
MAAAGSAAALLPNRLWAQAQQPGMLGPTAAERQAFFDAPRIVALELTISNQDMDLLRRDPRKYAKADLKEDGKTVYKEIGLKLKGAAGSFRGIDEKPGLTFNMDKNVDSQRFHGMDKLHLNNCAQDGSYISEMFCGELYRNAGVPASQCTHATLSLNGKRLGLFVLKEGYDKGFLKNHFGDSGGNFYDGGFLKDLDQPLEMNSGKGDQAELKSLAEVSREGDLNRRFERMERRLDIDRWVTYLCLQTFMWDWDGYPMNRNNYRIYWHPETKKITFIPSGMDQMFGDPNGPLFPNFNGFVARHFIETPEGKKRYVARMTQLMQDVVSPDKVNPRLEQIQKKLQPLFEPLDKGLSQGFPGHVGRYRDAIKQRVKVLTEQITKWKPKG